MGFCLLVALIPFLCPLLEAPKEHGGVRGIPPPPNTGPRAEASMNLEYHTYFRKESSNEE